jgi:phenylacetyl-CoA:acceptor oxidoreductase subunit 2
MKQSRNVASGPWPRLQRAWDIRAAFNFIGGGTGAGLLLMSLLAALDGRGWFVAAFAGLAFIAFGLFMVLLEIGKPWRAFNVFHHPQTSWMTREGVVALPLFACGGAALGLNLLGFDSFAVVALAAATACALGFLYCQARILRAARGIPTWRDRALTPYILAAGPAEGAGLYVALAVWTDGGTAWALPLAMVLILARALGWVWYRKGLDRRGAPEASLEVLDRMAPGFFLAGHALPLALFGAALAGLPGGIWMTTAGGLVAAIAGWQAKRVLITRAARTQGIAIPRTPVRGRGQSHAGAKPGWVNR